MFCKYCGEQLPDDAAFCAQCGKDLRPQKAPVENVPVTEDPTEKPYRPPLSFILLAVILFASVIPRDSVYLSSSMTIRMLGLAAGGLILFIGVHLLKIDIRSYRWSDAPALFCLLLLLPESRQVWKYFAARILGLDMYIVTRLTISLTEDLRLSCVWAAVGLLLLGLGRKGWRPRKKHYLLLAAALAVSALAAFSLSTFCAGAVVGSGNAAIDDLVGRAAGNWSILNCLWVAAILMVFWRLGTGKIGPAAAFVALLSILVAEILLIPVLLALLSLGITYFGLVTALASVVCILVTLMASLIRQKIQKKP